MAEEFAEVRPVGELMVSIANPILKFGRTITLGVRGAGGSLYVAQVHGDGVVRWVPHRIDATYTPTIHLMDDELAALHRALNQEPVRYKGDASIEHLQDAISMRDRLLAMVENSWAVTDGRRSTGSD